MIFKLFSVRAGQMVATFEADSLASAIANAERQARLFNRDWSDLVVDADDDPPESPERDRFGFAWTDGGAGEGGAR